MLDVLRAGKRQAALDPPGDGARLVQREVDPELALQHLIDGVDALRRGPASFSAREGGLVVEARGALGVVGEDAGHLVGRDHEVGDPCVPGGLGHAIELRALDVLHEDQTAGLVHVADAPRPVASAAREDDRHRARPALLRQRAKEHVDGEGKLLLPLLLAQEEAPTGDDHLLARRDEIDVVGLDAHPVLHEPDREVGMPREQLVHHALEVRREVLDDDEGHAQPARQMVEESLEGLESPGGCSDADDVIGEGASAGGAHAAVSDLRCARRDQGLVAHRGSVLLSAATRLGGAELGCFRDSALVQDEHQARGPFFRERYGNPRSSPRGGGRDQKPHEAVCNALTATSAHQNVPAVDAPVAVLLTLGGLQPVLADEEAEVEVIGAGGEIAAEDDVVLVDDRVPG